MIRVTLLKAEVEVLDRQPASSKDKGGWQNLLVTLRERVDRGNHSLVLDRTDIDRIRRYAFSYGNGGWENRLRAIFSRSLGPQLGRQFLDGDRAA